MNSEDAASKILTKDKSSIRDVSDAVRNKVNMDASQMTVDDNSKEAQQEWIDSAELGVEYSKNEHEMYQSMNRRSSDDKGFFVSLQSNLNQRLIFKQYIENCVQCFMDYNLMMWNTKIMLMGKFKADISQMMVMIKTMKQYKFIEH